jgi:hypothetical protein
MADRGDDMDFPFPAQHVHGIVNSPHFFFAILVKFRFALHMLLCYLKVTVTFRNKVTKEYVQDLALQQAAGRHCESGGIPGA